MSCFALLPLYSKQRQPFSSRPVNSLDSLCDFSIRLLLQASVLLNIHYVVTYAPETWMREKREEALGSFQRRILRCIFGKIQENSQWRRYISEIYNLYTETDPGNTLELTDYSGQGTWHERKTKSLRKENILPSQKGKQVIGRPKTTCLDGVDQEGERIKERNWWRHARNRDKWRKLVRKARAHPGLLSRWWWWWWWVLVTSRVRWSNDIVIDDHDDDDVAISDFLKQRYIAVSPDFVTSFQRKSY